MRLVLTLFLLALSLSLNTVHARERTNIVSSSTVRAIDEPDCAQSRKSPNNEKHIKRVKIRNQTGLDGKVQRIHLDSDEEDKPGIRAYGLPRKRLLDNGVIERVYVGEDIVDNPKSGRLVEAYGMPKDDMKTNGFIERLPSPSAIRESTRLGSRYENIRVSRSVRTGSENKVEEKIASEAEDMEADDTKVFRPLFVYRQQIAARQKRKHARNLAHKNHRHVNHQPCDHRREFY